MISNADKTIQKLKEEGDIIHFITARLMNIKNCDAEAITRKSLDNFNIPYGSLNLHISDKLTFCKEDGIDLLIEDKEIVRVNNWNEIYEEIENLRKVIEV